MSVETISTAPSSVRLHDNIGGIPTMTLQFRGDDRARAAYAALPADVADKSMLVTDTGGMARIATPMGDNPIGLLSGLGVPKAGLDAISGQVTNVHARRAVANITGDVSTGVGAIDAGMQALLNAAQRGAKGI